jgi:hypothetical protein
MIEVISCVQTKDQFGFYVVDDLKYYSKLMAIEAHQATGHHPRWDFNDSVFSLYDWTVEPEASLPDLYRQRAQQLRDKYDYIVLWFSGGADTDNVLHAFLDNGIKLDEVASYINFEATQDKTNYMNNEVFHVAYPVIKKHQEKHPDLVHRIIDVCKMQVDYFSQSETKFDWIYEMNAMFNPNNASRVAVREYVPEWKKMIDDGKRVLFLWGADKPRVGLVDGKYCFRFIDIIDNCVSPKVQMLNRPGDYDEFFYWSPDLPELIIKQAHIIKHYLRTATASSQFLTTEKTGLGSTIIDGVEYHLTTTGVSVLIYPNFIFYDETQGKPLSIFFTPRDTWFFSLPDDNLARVSWEVGITKLWKMLPDYWKNDPLDSSKALKQMWSKAYALE